MPTWAHAIPILLFRTSHNDLRPEDSKLHANHSECVYWPPKGGAACGTDRGSSGGTGPLYTVSGKTILSKRPLLTIVPPLAMERSLETTWVGESAAMQVGELAWPRE